MKKAIALLTTLVVLTSALFAEEAAAPELTMEERVAALEAVEAPAQLLSPTITGYVETKYGMDLKTKANGFELDSSATVTIPLFATETKATEGEGATGSASITGSSLTFTLGLDSLDDDDAFLSDDINSADSALTGTDASISAKLDLGMGAYLTIGSESDIATNMVSGDQKYQVKPDYGQQEGMSAGYKTDMFSIELTAANETKTTGGFAADSNSNATDEGYRTDTDVVAADKIVDVDEVTKGDDVANVSDGYVIGAAGMFTLGDMLTVDVAFGTTHTAVSKAVTARKYGLAGKITTMPITGLTIAVPVDFLNANNNVAFELLPTASFTTGALTVGADFHYISVAKELDTPSAAKAAFIPALYTQSVYTIDGKDYLTKLATPTVYELAKDVKTYVAKSDARDAVVGLTKDFTAKALNATVAYALDAGKASLTLGTNLEATGTSLELAASWTAPMYSVSVDAGNLLIAPAAAKPAVDEKPETLMIEKAKAKAATNAGPDDIDFDLGFSGVTGLTATVETVISLDAARGNSALFTVDKINLDVDSALTGLENTVITVNYSGFNFTDNPGILYAGVKISL